MRLIPFNPYDYNAISLKKHPMNREQIVEKRRDLPSPVYALLNQNANVIAKWIGVDTRHEWSDVYDLVWDVYEWARIETKSDDINKQIDWLNEKINNSPSLHTNRLLDLHMTYLLAQKKEKEPAKMQADNQPPVPREQTPEVTEEASQDDTETTQTEEKEVDNYGIHDS